jgi:hypothetical protein
MRQPRVLHLALLVCLVSCHHCKGTNNGGGPGNLGQDDFCAGSGPNCDVQHVAVRLLDPRSSRVLVSKPEEFIGGVYDAHRRDGIYSTFRSCGPLDPSNLDLLTEASGTVAVSDKYSSELQAKVSASLRSLVSADLASDVDDAVRRTTMATLSYTRKVYALNANAMAARRKQCREALCGASGEKCESYLRYVLIDSAAIITISGSLDRSIFNQLKANIATHADLSAAFAQASLNAGASLDSLLDHKIAETISKYQFAAYLGWQSKIIETLQNE